MTVGTISIEKSSRVQNSDWATCVIIYLHYSNLAVWRTKRMSWRRGGERRVFLQSASNHDWLSLINYPSQAPSSLHFKSSLGSIPTFDNHHLLSIVFPMGQKKNNSRIDGFSLSIANKSLRQPRRRPRALFRPGSRIATHAHQSAFVDLISYSTVTRAAGRGR